MSYVLFLVFSQQLSQERVFSVWLTTEARFSCILRKSKQTSQSSDMECTSGEETTHNSETYAWYIYESFSPGTDPGEVQVFS